MMMAPSLCLPSGGGVIFDMDGLMLDSETVAKICWESSLRARGHAMTDALFQSMIGHNKQNGGELLQRAFGAAFDVEAAYASCHLHYEEHVERHGLALKPGVGELLDELTAQGVPVAVATSTKKMYAPRRLEQANLLRYFPIVVGGDEVAQGKPAPDIYLEAVRRLGVDAGRTFALEDSHAGVRAAHAAGLQVIMVPDLLPATEEMALLTHRIFPSLHEVRAYWRAAPDAPTRDESRRSELPVLPSQRPGEKL